MGETRALWGSGLEGEKKENRQDWGDETEGGLGLPGVQATWAPPQTSVNWVLTRALHGDRRTKIRRDVFVEREPSLGVPPDVRTSGRRLSGPDH